MSQFPEPSFNDPFAQPLEQSKGMAIGSLITGIIGFIPPLGIVAIILGIIAARRAKADPTRYGGGGMAIGGIIAGSVTTVGMCVIAGFAAILIPAFGQARQSARHIVTESNLRQIGVALHSYAADNKDFLPPADWKTALAPSYISVVVFDRLGGTRGEDAFRFVGASRRLGEIPFPNREVLAYELEPTTTRNRVIVLHADGSVETIQSSQLPGLLATGGAPGAVPIPGVPGPAGTRPGRKPSGP